MDTDLAVLTEDFYNRPSLYVHVPFCAKRCRYCDFCSTAISKNSELLNTYLRRALEDFSHLAPVSKGPLALSTVFIGGGTPSLLGAGRLGRLLNTILSEAQGLKEITVEVNPESLDIELLNSFAQSLQLAQAGGRAGEDLRFRISLGVQSLHGQLRQNIGRIGGADMVLQALDMCRAFPQFELSVDIMAGLPGQNVKNVLDDIDVLLNKNLSHLSLYSLILEEGSELFKMVQRGQLALPDEDVVAEQLFEGAKALEVGGLARYEIANYARAGRQCLHNLRYWHMASWYAIGPSASASFFNRRGPELWRSTVDTDIASWLKGPAEMSEEKVEGWAAEFEFLMMGFRLVSGPNADEFSRRFGRSIEMAIPQSLKKWREKNLARPDIPALNVQGLMFLNAFLCDCLKELEA